jgi:hypothetical protein
MFIIVDGTILTKFKAGLDLEFPASPQNPKTPKPHYYEIL